MKYILYISLVLSITSCSYIGGYDYKLINLHQKELPYNELPNEVKDYLASMAHDISNEFLVFVNPADSSRYRSEDVPPLISISTWISYYKLIDTDKDIIYKIEYGTPYPWIIHNNRLYIPEGWNIGERNYTKYKYTEYKLK
ncbi:MAG: response regulator [Prevotella sp.]|nr:response regulator [Prevotella sp.]